MIGDRNDQHTVVSDNHTHHLVTEEDLKKLIKKKPEQKVERSGNGIEGDGEKG